MLQQLSHSPVLARFRETEAFVINTTNFQAVQASIDHIPSLAATLLSLLSQAGSPILAAELFSDVLIQLGHEQLMLIFEKAAIFYTHSIRIDLDQLARGEEPIFVPSELIQNAIEELNWRNLIENSQATENQEQVSDNPVLMKFFEGLRNHQNFKENLHKEALLKLEAYSKNIEVSLNVGKGAAVERISSIWTAIRKSQMRQPFTRWSLVKRTEKALKGIEKIEKHHTMQAFYSLQIWAAAPPPEVGLRRLASKLLLLKEKENIRREFKSLKRSSDSLGRFVTILDKFKQQKYNEIVAFFFQRLPSSKTFRFGKLILLATQLQRKAKILIYRELFQRLQVRQILVCNKLHQSYLFWLKSAFDLVSKAFLNQSLRKPSLSDRLKGRILVQLFRRKEKTPSLRNAFLQWFSHAHQAHYFKQIYNIWLHDKTSKFTFFMRMKDYVSQGKAKEVKPTLKMFLRTYSRLLNRNLSEGIKNCFTRWLVSSRRHKKANKLARTLRMREGEKADKYTREAFEAIYFFAKKKAVLATFLQKCISNRHFVNQQARATLSTLPSLKAQGSAQLRRLIQKNINQMQGDSKFGWESFKRLGIIGSNRKRQICARYFGRDTAVIQRFFSLWRERKNFIHNQLVKRDGSRIFNLLSLQQVIEVFTDRKTTEAIQTFKKQRLRQLSKQLQIKESLRKVISRANSKACHFVLDTLQSNSTVAAQKRLVLAQRLRDGMLKWLSSAFQTYKAKASLMRQADKVTCLQGFMVTSLTVFQQTLTLFNRKDHTYRALNVLLMSRKSKAQMSMKLLLNVPQRVQWQKRQNAMYFQKGLELIFKRRHNEAIKPFLACASRGETLKRRLFQLSHQSMMCVLSHYFQTFRREASSIKVSQKHQAISSAFLSIGQTIRLNYHGLYFGQPIWEMKLQIVSKVVTEIERRTLSAFGLWRRAAQKLRESDGIQNIQKAKAIFGLSSLVAKQFQHKTKSSVQKFYKGWKINQLQLNFLRKLCDSRAGKMVKAYMLWKGLPEPKNKEQINKVTTFENKIAKLALLNIKRSFGAFKDRHYAGNERKKLAIRKMISCCSSGVQGYFERWRNNNKLYLLFQKCRQVQKSFQATQSVMFESLETLVDLQRVKEIENKLRFSNIWLQKISQQYFTKWRSQTKSLRKLNQSRLQKLRGVFNMRQRQFETKMRVQVLFKFRLQLRDASLQKQREPQVIRLFAVAQEAFREHLNIIFVSQRELALKKKVIDRLLRNSVSAAKSIINRWQVATAQVRFESALTDKSKTILLERISGLLSRVELEGAKGVVRCFHTNWKIISVQRKFMDRLLQTKGGKVIEAFKKWQTLPERNASQKYRRGQKFLFKLESQLRDRIRKTYRSLLTDNLNSGNNMKKQAILKLVDATSSGFRRYYSRWEKNTVRTSILLAASMTEIFMNIANEKASQTIADALFDKDLTIEKKKAVIGFVDRIKAKQGYALSLWRQATARINAMTNELKEKKALALRIFTNIIGNANKASTVAAIHSFKTNASVFKVCRNFFNKLLQTKSGKVIGLFQKWKSIPNAKLVAKKRKGIIFESRLSKFALLKFKETFYGFKMCNQASDTRKKYCIDRMIKASMGDERRQILKWRNVTREGKIFQSTESLEKLFSHLNIINEQHLLPIFSEAKADVVVKQRLCRSLISYTNFMQQQAYLLWQMSVHQIKGHEKAKNSLKKERLLNISTIQQRSVSCRINSVLSAFRMYLTVHLGESKHQIDAKKYQKATQFYRQLEVQTQSRQRMVVMVLRVAKLQSNITDNYLAVSNAFSSLHSGYSELVQSYLFADNKRQKLKALFSLVAKGCEVKLRSSLGIWRQKSSELGMHEVMLTDKKKSLLGLLTRLLSNTSEGKIVKTVRKFHTNYKIIKVQKEFLMKILNCKAGKVPILFMKWKALPFQGAKVIKQKAMKFELGIARLAMQRLKTPFSNFRDISHESNLRKKQSISRMIRATLSDNNRLFGKWRVVAREAKMLEKIMGLEKTLSIASQIAIQTYSELFTRDIAVLKKDAVKKLYYNLEQKLVASFYAWRSTNRNHKQKLLTKLCDILQPQKWRTSQMKSAFFMIDKWQCLEGQRGLINSLWSWKVTNNEMGYVNKIIRVFRESEELSHSAIILTNRLRDNYHTAFSLIQAAAASRKATKDRVLLKYSQKKLKHYFDLLRVATYSQTIHIWQVRYNHAVKAQAMFQSLQTVLNRHMHSNWQCLRQKNLKFSLILDGSASIQGFSCKIMKYAFKRVKFAAQASFIESISKLTAQRRLFNLQDAFRRLQSLRSVNRLDEIVTKVHRISSMRTGLGRIRATALANADQHASLIELSSALQEQQQTLRNQLFKALLNRAQKLSGVRKIGVFFSNILNSHFHKFFMEARILESNGMVLLRFQRGSLIKKILDRASRKVLKRYLARLKQRPNPWQAKSMRLLAVKNSVKSSLAVSLWRMKSFAKIE